jgi:FKBP-type peptidyl-prolyl cis-trans isomerase
MIYKGAFLQSLRQYSHSMLEKLRKLFATPHARELERKLSMVGEENHALQLEFRAVQRELQDVKTKDQGQLNALQQRIIDIEAARDEARQRVDALTQNLTEASSRLDSAETRVNLLDRQLENEDRKRQIEMQEMQALANRQERRLKWVLMLASFAFLLASLAGITEIRGVRKNAELLADVSRNIKYIMSSIASQNHMAQNQAGDRQAESASDSLVYLQNEKDSAAADRGEPVMAEGPVDKPQPGSQQETVSFEDVTTAPLPHSIPVQSTRDEMEAFFEQNARKPGVITRPSGLQYKVLRQGNGRSPSVTDKVVIDYRGFLLDETEFDNTYSEVEPATFLVDELTTGMKEAVLQMDEGAQWQLYIPPALAHKGGVRKRGITGYEPQFYVVELISIIPGEKTAKP